MKIKISELEKIVENILLKHYSVEEVSLIKEVIMFGELSGRVTHGIMRLLPENYGAIVEGITAQPQLINKTKVSSLINGNGNPAMLVCQLAKNEVIRLAKEHGFGIVSTKGTTGSSGALTYYAKEIAKEDLICFMCSQASPLMSAFGTKNPVFGTNPLAFGFPNDPRPLVFDMATSAITYGAIKNAKRNSQTLPENVAVDSEGNMTTNPEKALDGSVLPFQNSHKGSGLAMIVEILGAVLPGASFMGVNDGHDGDGNLIIAFSPELISDISSFKSRLTQMIKELKSQETTTGEVVRLPSENTFKNFDENLSKGEIEISDELLEKIKSVPLD